MENIAEPILAYSGMDH